MPGDPHKPTPAIEVWGDEQQLAAFVFQATRVLFSDLLDFRRTLRNVARFAVPEFADWCVVDLATDDGAIERVEVFHPDPARHGAAAELLRRPPDPASANGAALAIREGRPELVTEAGRDLLLERATTDSHLQAALDLGMRSWLVVPLVARGRTLGAFSFVLGDSGRRYREEHLRVALGFAQTIALAIDNARLVSELSAARERAERLTALQERLVAVVSHDLRSPLSAVKLTAEAALAHPRPDRTATAMNRIASSAKRMERIISELLDFARARQAGGIPVDRRPARIEDVCARAIHEVRAAHPDRSIELALSGPGEGEWDASRLEQVISNLVLNAIQYSARGEAVHVRAEGTPDDVRLEVRNRGPAIPEDLLPHLFDPFRAGSRKGSVGLGLFIVREIVRAHGGDVAVASAEESGTTFTVRLPRSSPRSSRPSDR